MIKPVKENSTLWFLRVSLARSSAMKQFLTIGVYYRKLKSITKKLPYSLLR